VRSELSSRRRFMSFEYKSVLRGALLTVLSLFGGLFIGLVAGDIVFQLIPGSSVTDVKLGHAAIAAIPALGGFLAGGALWGVQMGRIPRAGHLPRMAWAGMLGFGPITIALAIGLGLAEPVIVEILAQIGQPIHRVFTLLFVPSTFLIAGISAWSIGVGLRDNRLAWSLLWRVGLVAATAFLGVNLTMEALGWVVGAPGAGERATMITVLAIGNICAALTGGALIGRILGQYQKR
jgi:hypothetical protein